MSPNIHTKDIMASLPLVASVLGARYGVNVIVGGDQACTNGKTIMLPTLPLDCDAELLALAKGYLDHEASHIRHTDFRALQAARLTPVQKHLWNILEDWRCENALAQLFPGCRQHFRWLIQHHFGKDKDDAKAGDTNPAKTVLPSLSVLEYVLLSVRAWDVPAIGQRRDKVGTLIQQLYPYLRDELDGILAHVRHHCGSTEDAIHYALELYAAIEKYTNKNKDKLEKELADRTVDSRMDKDEESSDPSDSPQSIRTTRTARTQAQQQLENLLHAAEGDLPLALGEQLAEILNAQQSKPHQQGLVVARTGYKHTSLLPEDVRTESVKGSVALRARLHGLLQAVTQQPCVVGRRGKLCPHRLHSLAAHNPRVFLKRGEKRQTSTAVHLLLDSSGSMSGTRMALATRACYAVALALGQCRGVNVGVTAFPGNDTRLGVTVAPILRHGERVHHKFGMSGMGYTPLAEALWWVVQRMYPLKEERKIICILSDGSPDSVPAARYALKQADTLGFEVMGLGMQDNSLDALLHPLGMPSRSIHNMQELAPAMFGMLQKALLKQGGQA